MQVFAMINNVDKQRDRCKRECEELIEKEDVLKNLFVILSWRM